MSTAPSEWQRFAHPLFRIEFSYPDPTPEGHAVERTEGDRGDMQRVHLRSLTSTELYFEATRFAGRTPHDEYSRHRPYLEQRFGQGAVDDLTETMLGGRPASRYAFHWEAGERAVVSLGLAGETYRLIYDPSSPLNEEILSTVRVREQD